VAGAASAFHAERLVVPRLLAVRLPDAVSFEQGATVALGAIAMQGIRRSAAQLGERIAVIGCGAIGLLTIQMLKAAGCRVLALDIDAERLTMAQQCGASVTAVAGEPDTVQRIQHACDGQGADAVLITAAAASSAPLQWAFQMARRRGRVVLIGAAGSEYSRDLMYAKELDFLISTSYGPGRYDDTYEAEGRDYPYAYVRWTERRNMAAYLELIAQGQVHPEWLMGGRWPVEQAEAAYQALQSAARPILAIIHYERTTAPEPAPPPAPAERIVTASPRAARLGLSLVGTGGFVRQVHVPLLAERTAALAIDWIVNHSVLSARRVARFFPGSRVSCDPNDAFQSKDTAAVLVGTRNGSHAELALRALQAGKGVFLEKPLCLHPQELDAIRRALEVSAAPVFMVGYNRRFSCYARALRRQTAARINPLVIQYTMNVGYLPPDHWVYGSDGGGRLLAEACHIVDLFRFLIGAPLRSISVNTMVPATANMRAADNAVATLTYADGSLATLSYIACGSTAASKERMQLFFDEKTFILNDYVQLEGFGCRFAPLRTRIQDKGHGDEWIAFLEAWKTGARFPIPWAELEETWRACWMMQQWADHGDWPGGSAAE